MMGVLIGVAKATRRIRQRNTDGVDICPAPANIRARVRFATKTQFWLILPEATAIGV